MSELLRASRVAAVPHGFRSSFRDWSAEETDHPRELAEPALAHMVRGPIEAACSAQTCSSAGSWVMGPAIWFS
ncbi:MAG: hypothetical protein OXB98_20055 [Bryobacterales bacterium]|nr:hypothetical protein [Bryobacterales bacterium]